MNRKVAIIGYGWVGQAVHELFPDAFLYSHNLIINNEGNWVRTANGGQAWNEKKEDYKNTVNSADFAFICVPTPVIHSKNTDPTAEEIAKEDTLDTSIVEEIIKWCQAKVIVVRSTVNPGDCDMWQEKYNKTIVFQPEYLGETPQHPLLDTVKTPFLVIGGLPMARRLLIRLYQEVYNANVTITQVSLKEAEVIKLSENRAIAFKVSQCQELYDVCEKAGVDYYTVRDAVYGDDPRFNLWWTFVYPEKRGFNSKCIPKDIYAWAAWAESIGYEPKVTRAILEKNKEWINA